jgi:phosphocarrier protein FPr
LVVAAVAAAGGAGRAEVAAEAQSALMGKAAHLGEAAGIPPDASSAGGEAKVGTEAELVGEFTVENRHGLHARPAARLVSEVRDLDADVRLHNLTTGVGPVPAASLSRVATLGAMHGHRVQIRASGPQASDAVERLRTLAVRHFDEPLEEPSSPQSGQHGAGPLPASPGIGIGVVRRFVASPVPADESPAGSPAAEWQRVVDALVEVRREIERLRRLAGQVGQQEARIFDAHLMLLDDEDLLAEVKTRVDSGASAVIACTQAFAAVEKQWAELPDPYLRARAEDVRAVTGQLLAALTGATALTMSGPGILVAEELSPGQTAELDAETVRGIILAYGSPTSHAAIIARSRGIPALVAAGPGVLALAEGTTVVLDGSTGELVADPSSGVLGEYQHRAAEQAAQHDKDRAAASEPAHTVDGTDIEVAANLGSCADALAAALDGADSAGLVRTEFLFLDRDRAPDTAEQVAEYLALADALGGRRITLRTLDVGGDKPLPYLPMPAEENPFLGHRGIRLSLGRRDLLLEQLTAICEVARKTPISVMFPMVSTVTEIRAARQALDEAAGPGGLPDGLRIGMMVEVPAAALKIETFLPYLDFISIGTNDLTQYTLAAERGNAAVAALSDPLDPGVLSLILRVCQAADGRAPVAVCGEAAADPTAIPVLLGLGVRELSVSPRSVPSVKARVRELDLSACVALAKAALRLDDAESVRQLSAHSDVSQESAPRRTLVS